MTAPAPEPPGRVPHPRAADEPLRLVLAHILAGAWEQPTPTDAPYLGELAAIVTDLVPLLAPWVRDHQHGILTIRINGPHGYSIDQTHTTRAVERRRS